MSEHKVGDKRQNDGELDPNGQEDGAVAQYDDTGLEGTGLEDTGLEGTGLEDTGLDGTGLEDTGLDGTGLEGTGLDEQDEDDDLFGEDERPGSPIAEVQQQQREDELDELHDEAHVSEAEEDAPVEKKKKGGEDMQEMFNIVKAFISKLEYTAEADSSAFESAQPAVKKLGMLKETSMEVQSKWDARVKRKVLLEDMIAMKKRHETLLNGGLLGALKTWLEPLTDPKTKRMVLPHASVRAAVYRALARLPLDTHHQEARDRLKTSGIGPILVFYSKCSAETPANQRSANDLVQNWIMPIVEEGRHDMRNQESATLRKQEQKQSLKLRRREEKKADALEAERAKQAQEGQRVGTSGYRYHARVPKQARLDYVEMPQVPQAVRFRAAVFPRSALKA